MNTIIRKPLTIALLMGALLFSFALTGHAQEKLTSDEKTQVEAPQTSLLTKFNQGGLAMYPLLLLSMGALTLIILNGIMLQRKKFLKEELIGEVNVALAAGDVERAKSICDSNPSPVTNIIAGGLDRYDPWHPDLQLVEKSMEEASSEELAGPFVFINYLSVIGSLAPMVGLLGTVSGMVKAFDVIGREGTGNPQVLAGNISEALITTASGMMVGIPAMFFYFYFKNYYGKHVSRITRMLGDVSFSLRTYLYGGVVEEAEAVEE